MSIEIVTEDRNTHDKEVLEASAISLIVRVLDEYDAEPWEMSLISNINNTLKHN